MPRIRPSREEFLRQVETGAPVPVSTGPLEPSFTPVQAFEAVRSGDYSVLLESAKVHPKIGRYSYVCTEPYLVFRSSGSEVSIIRGGREAVSSRKPLAKLRELTTAYTSRRVDGLPPFTGGSVGMLSYDFVHNFENIPATAENDLRIPDAYFIFVDTVIAFDHVEGKVWLIANPGASALGLGLQDAAGIDWAVAYDEAVGKLEALLAKLENASGISEEPSVAGRGGIKAKPLIPKEAYESMVSRAKEYIAAGDIFQANLSQRLSADVPGIDPWDIYKLLRAVNPSPFASYIDFPEFSVASSSPERLVRLHGSTVDTRPIAGTRPRGRDKPGDEEMRVELLLNEKERAEHIMLIDLERNDIGRVCDYGSVHVDELMVTEDYSHVIHIVSNVTGTLADGRDAFDVIRATFPGGTITGVPKVRCMEIIDELEPVTRGPYTGSIGWISFSGDMDLNIVIRTFVIKDGVAYVQVGAGIVADSDPEREYYETLHKAEALVKTLEQL